MKLPLVYIHSASHSGSTLLSLLLARHPEIVTIGELSGTRYRAKPGYKCSCGAELVQCRFWGEVSAAMARRGFSYSATTAETDIRNAQYPVVRRLLKPMHRGRLLELVRDVALVLAPGGLEHIRQQARVKAALVESIVECSGKPVVVDSSKSGLQLKYHLRNPSLDVKVIWLVRDGRGVSLSLARNQGQKLAHGAYQWRRTYEEAESIVRGVEPGRWVQVRYEGLCAEPEFTLERLWRFIGVSPAPVNGSTPEYHVMGHYSRLNGAAKIQLNEKWRTELTAEDLRTFDGVAGPLNRQLGYV